MNCIDLSHGAGGKRFNDLLTGTILPALGREENQLHDGALLGEAPGRLVMTTDSHVVSPLFFHGGDIGHLGFCGTVNDLAMMGAKPLYLTLSLIIEEGLSIKLLRDALSSFGKLSQQFSIPVVAGDTKVVERGKGDGLYLSVAGIGVIESEHTQLSPSIITPGSAMIINGSLGDHSIAIMSEREGLEFETEVKSDCAPLHETVLPLLDQFPEIMCCRDITRGGLAGVLNEISEESSLSFEVEQGKVPIQPAVQSACDLLGLDPLALANEGKFVLFAPNSIAEQILTRLRKLPYGQEASIIGQAFKEQRPKVTVKTKLGGSRMLLWPIGEQLPRIC